MMEPNLKSTDKAQSYEPIEHSIRKHLVTASAAIFILVGLGGLWSAFTEVSSAVIAYGTVVVEGDVKKIQHREGGIVREILVEEGQEVDAGELLVRLDDTLVRSNYDIVINQLIELDARYARLVAERDSQSKIKFSENKYGSNLAAYEETKTTQSMLLNARTSGLEKHKGQFREQIEQLEEQIAGLKTRLETKQEELELIDEQLNDATQLFEKNLVAKSRITELKRDKTRISGEHGELASQIAGIGETISETNMKLLQVEEENREEILRELQEVTNQVAELKLKRITLEDELSRLDIRAPLAGYVHHLDAHTIGGVVPPGSTILQVVPRDDQLVVDAQVNPSDIDQIHLGQESMIRLPSFDQRKTPKLAAKIHTIAADQSVDETTQRSFYHIRLQVSVDELTKLGDQRLVPGMPVEVFVTTGNRTVLAYLSKPFLDQIAHSMKES